MGLTHVNEAGKADMVDVSAKPVVRREAVARGKIFLQPPTLALIRENGVRKGDVLAAARLAGIAAAKKTWELIPLCHNIPIDKVGVDFELQDDGVVIAARAVCSARTGIEMEALTAVSVAALTVYDMCKAVDQDMVIGPIALVEKRKGG
ncbi:MAG: molybdenum cofactor biosynthesis protein C [Elusimicrobia bacterium GWA2_69_24]|nr:MAG: molybdenum cofactor biosynthesis protein C [Elusimicrobia bacterium GWA2_69_24]